jgi:putative phage-type endonuclease
MQERAVQWRDCATEDDWLAERRNGVGASEAAGVVGLSPWTTPLEIYMRKRGELRPSEEPRLIWGKKLEPLVADEYSRQTGIPLEKPLSICWRPEAPWMRASLDYWVPGDRVVEIKTVSQWFDWGEPRTDEVPKHYALQVQQQMECCGLQYADIAALCLNSWKLRIYHLTRQQPVIDMLLTAEEQFMERVRIGDAPLPDFAHPSTAEILNLLEPLPYSVIPLGDAEQLLASKYQELGETIKDLEAQRKESKARLIHAMGTAEEGDLPDGRTVRRKTIERKGYVVDPTSYVDFRIQKPRKVG